MLTLWHGFSPKEDLILTNPVILKLKFKKLFFYTNKIKIKTRMMIIINVAKFRNLMNYMLIQI